MSQKRSSLIAHVVTLVAFALFAIEIAVLVPFTWLYWQRLVELRRDELERQADAARPHVREALFRVRENEVFQSVGSSRVDLQACKLEYSIVSPK